jgi:plastocyanin
MLLSLGMLFNVFAILASTNFVEGQDQALRADIIIVSKAFTLGDKAFHPNLLEIHVGSTMIWTNDDFGIHTVNHNNGMFESDCDQTTHLSTRLPKLEHMIIIVCYIPQW